MRSFAALKVVVCNLTCALLEFGLAVGVLLALMCFLAASGLKRTQTPGSPKMLFVSPEVRQGCARGFREIASRQSQTSPTTLASDG
jgi:hypothetical protein